ncbi:hypothetical protein [Agromyces seonyuensis]|uniref:Major capsid protein n=1 Tax=Agromyces seonyuensis TaxID=2662446 RepID=A0A6I4P0P7_9MICO|nr:hypothetical protein [Agromyces seonyuensis]MWB98305.1 hypothetical protein [Agromyces seonyuensis]
MPRGFNVGADVLTRTADGVDLNLIWNEFNDALTAWNAGRSAVAALFSFPTVDSFVQYAVGEGDLELELASEFGVPTSGRAEPDYARMGFPLDWYDKAKRYTRKFLRDATAEQVRAQHAAFLEADNKLVFRSVMKALTTKTASGSRSINENGVEIFDLWDGTDSVAPPSFGGKTFTNSHSHYLVSGAATIDGGDLKALIDTIQEHGFGSRGSNEQIVIMVHPTQGDVIKTFRRDPENAAVDPFDFIPAVNAPAYLTDQAIVGDKAPASFNSLALIGSYGDAWIHENYLIPQGYAIALATAGPNAGRNPVAFRQHPQAENQGFRLLPGHERYPLLDSVYERGFGVGVRHRSAAAVMQIKASGSYDNPTWP